MLATFADWKGRAIAHTSLGCWCGAHSLGYPGRDMPVDEWLACRHAGWHAIAVAIQREGDQALASYIHAGLAFARPGDVADGDAVRLCSSPECVFAVRAVAAALGVPITGCDTVHAGAVATFAAIEAALRRNR